MKKIILCIIFVVSAGFSLCAQEWGDWLAVDEALLSKRTVIAEADDPMIVRFMVNGEQAEKKVLFLFPKKSSAYNTELNKILHVFDDKGFFTDVTVINFKGDQLLGEAALEYAENNDMDLIFSMGSTSTTFVHKNYSGGDIPVVSVCSKDPVLMGQMAGYENGSGTNIAYTSLNVPIELQMKYLLELMPDIENIGIMYARNNSSAVKTQVEPLKAKAQEYYLDFIDIVVEDQQAAKEELAAKIPQVVRSMVVRDPGLNKSIFWITGSTSVFKEIETINKYAADIPVISVVPDVVQEGDNSAALSIGVSFESNAHLAALYALDILQEGVDPGTMPVGVISPPDIAINFKKTRQIGFKIPYNLFEIATIIYDHQGKQVR